MRLKDAEFLNTTEEGLFLQSRLLALGLVNEKLPCVPSWVTYAELRRMVKRLRSGKLRGDPRIPPDAFADFIEASIEQDMMVHAVTMAAIEETERERERNEAKRRKRYVAGFHRLKKSARAADPDSPLVEKVRRIHRLRRRELGRRGRRGR